MPAERKDPFLRYNFVVEIEGLVAGGFQEVTGLQSEIEIQEYREGGLNDYIHRRAGPVKYGNNLILRHGVTDVKTLWNWYCNTTQGIIERRNLSVVLMDSKGQEKVRWNFAQAYPVKWAGPEFRSSAAEIAVQTVELAHNGISKG